MGFSFGDIAKPFYGLFSHDEEAAQLDKANQAAKQKTLAELQPYTYQFDQGLFAPINGAAATAADNQGNQQAFMGGQDRDAALGAYGTGGYAYGVAGQNLNALQGIGNRQNSFADTLQAQYLNGNAPSAAQAQLNNATAENLAMQRSLAASSGNPAAAYQAQNNMAVAQTQAANNAAMLRAQEQQALLGNALTSRAGAAETTGAVVNGRTTLGNAFTALGGQRDATSLQRADLQSKLRDQATGFRSDDRNAGIRGAEDQASAYNNAGSNAVGAAGNQITGASVGLKADAEQDAQNRGAVEGGLKAGASLFSDSRSKERIKSLERDNAALRELASAGAGADSVFAAPGPAPVARAESPFSGGTTPAAAPSTPALPPGAVARFPDAGAPAAAPTAGVARFPDRVSGAVTAKSTGWNPDAPPEPESPFDDDSRRYHNAYFRTMAAYDKGAAAPLAAQGGVWSDERAKTGVADGSDVRDMFDEAPPKTFEYRPGYGPPGRRPGLLADDLEKTELGKSLVSRDPRTGMRQVDVPQMTMANGAMISDLERRLSSLEGGRRRG